MYTISKPIEKVNPASRKYYKSLDVMKLIAALLVITIHSKPFSGLTEDIIVGVFARMAVPFFFIASAFLFFKKAVTKERLKHYVSRMAMLYLFWFILEMPWTIYAYFVKPDASILMNTIHFIRNVFLGSTFRGSWFITSLIICVPMVAFLSRKLSDRVIWMIGLCLYLFAVVTSYYVQFLLPDVQFTIESLDKVIGQPQNNFIIALIYVVTGKMVAENEDCIESGLIRYKKAYTVVLFLLIILGIIEVLVVKSFNPPGKDDSYLMLYPIVTTIFLLTISINMNMKLNYQRIRNYSTIFYFSHFIFVMLFVKLSKHVIYINPILRYLLIVLCCSIVSECIIRLSSIEKLKWLKYAY